MDVEFDTNIDDVVELNFHNLHYHPLVKRRIKSTKFLYVFLIVIFAFLGLFSIYVVSDPSIAIVTFAGAIILLILYFFQFNSSQLRKRIKKIVIKEYPKTPNDEICRSKVSISEDGFHTASDFQNSTFRWTAFSDIVRTEQYAYLFLRPGKTFVVPKRAFSDDAAFNRFVETARSYQSKAAK